MDWRPLNLDDIPTCAGVYGWQHQGTWLYIGQSKNLSKRLNTQHKPLRIALSLELEISYWYIPHEAPRRLERQLHKTLQPLWCGGLDIHAKYPGHPSCVWMQESVSREEIAEAISHI